MSDGLENDGNYYQRKLQNQNSELQKVRLNKEMLEAGAG